MRERINNTENESLIKKKPTPKPNNWGNKGFTNKDTDCNKQAENDIKRVMPIDSKNMNFDFNPSIEITINNVENDIWQSYLSATSTVVMTGKSYITGWLVDKNGLKTKFFTFVKFTLLT